MRKYILAISLGIIALGLSSCRRDSTTPAEVKEELQQRKVVFTASGRDYDVKSSSSESFVNGDIIGIIAPDLGRMNVRGTVSGKDLIPETRIMWEPGQTSNSDFYAYYPYITGLDSSTEKFAVAPDQSSLEAYRASDLRTAHVNAAPHSTVAFVLKHSFSRITFAFTSKVSGETAEKVVLKDLCTEAVVDIATGSPAAGGSKTDIVALGPQDGRFSAIVVPQPYTKVVVTTSKGRELSYTIYSPVTLESGCAYIANLTIPEAGHYPSEIGFTLSITDWENGGTVSYGEPEKVESL